MKFNKSFYLGKKNIQNFNSVYFIAEAGSNHNQILSRALKMVDVAKECGADAIKFQLIYPDGIAVGKKTKYGILKNKFKKFGKTYFDLYSKSSFDFKKFKIIKNYCKKKKIDFLVSVFCKNSLEDAIKLQVKAIKIASLELFDLNLIKDVAKTKIPIILSTGSSNLSDVTRTMKEIYKKNNKKVCLLQCTSTYPANADELNLKCINTFKNEFNVPTGFSDHSLGEFASVVAGSMGAAIIEKHFTINKKDSGPDHSFSINPIELKSLIRKIREVEIFHGKGVKRLTKSEKTEALKGRPSIFAKKKILKNEFFTLKNLKIVRPNLGLPPKNFNKLLKKKAKKNILEDEPIFWSSIK